MSLSSQEESVLRKRRQERSGALRIGRSNNPGPNHTTFLTSRGCPFPQPRWRQGEQLWAALGSSALDPASGLPHLALMDAQVVTVRAAARINTLINTTWNPAAFFSPPQTGVEGLGSCRGEREINSNAENSTR